MWFFHGVIHLSSLYWFSVLKMEQLPCSVYINDYFNLLNYSNRFGFAILTSFRGMNRCLFFLKYVTKLTCTHRMDMKEAMEGQISWKVKSGLLAQVGQQFNPTYICSKLVNLIYIWMNSKLIRVDESR